MIGCLIPSSVVSGVAIGFFVGLGWLSGGEELTMAVAGLSRMRAPSIEQLLLAALPFGVLYWMAFRAASQEA